MVHEVVFQIRRFEPGHDRPRWEEHRLAVTPGMTILDGLRRLKEGAVPQLAWRSSCRMGICGSCGMLINGRPQLACNTQIADLGPGPVSVAPLPNFAILRDLVPDLGPLFEAHAGLSPFLLRPDAEEQQHPTREYHQTPHEMERYLQFSYCIKCGCCMSACPTYATDPAYSGPMPLAQAYRYHADSRDDGFETRSATLGGIAGPWRCHYAGECSRVCPKGVDPARAVQLLRRELTLAAVGLWRPHAPAPLAPVRQGTARADVPKPPARSVGGAR